MIEILVFTVLKHLHVCYEFILYDYVILVVVNVGENLGYLVVGNRPENITNVLSEIIYQEKKTQKTF